MGGMVTPYYGSVRVFHETALERKAREERDAKARADAVDAVRKIREKSGIFARPFLPEDEGGEE